MGTPEEEVGYLASDEYMQRMASPAPDSRFDAQPAVESPLRKMSFPVSETQPKSPIPPSLSHHRSSSHGHSEGVIHVDDPMHHLHHPDGFAPTPAFEDHTSEIEEPAEEEDPILAADGVRPESAYLHPAVSPTFEHRGSFDEDSHSRTPSISHSRSNSRSASAGGAPMLTRFDSREMHDDNHTPLEDVEEYEPLFPEDESKKEGPISAAERFKNRPDMLKHRFPSQDIWEDTPNSLQYYATVTTPDLPKRDSSEAFETPEQEAARRMQTEKIDSHKVARQILEGDGARGKGKPLRPDYKQQRFPSRDIWEDAPDSQQLVTTVEPATDEVKSPEGSSKPSIPMRPQKQAQSTSPTEKRQPPMIPDRPKPQIPTRPAKSSPQASAEGAAAPKAKPAVPARPGGSKIAALKAGFLTDLNSRLQQGPQQTKPQEKESEPAAEKQPLSDARKGRARGPTRRKPAVENANARLPTIPEIKITTAWNVWSVGEDGDLTVGNEASPTNTKSTIPSELPAAPELAKNTAGEPVDPTPESAVGDVVSPSTVEPLVDSIPAKSLETSEPAEISVEATEPAPKKDDPEESPSGATALAEAVPTSTTLDKALEDMTASADGKRTSDGDIHAKEEF